MGAAVLVERGLPERLERAVLLAAQLGDLLEPERQLELLVAPRVRSGQIGLVEEHGHGRAAGLVRLCSRGTGTVRL